MPLSERCEVVITAPDPNFLRAFSRQLVEDRLCASANNFQPDQSIYRWRGDIYERQEGRASLHTSRARVPEIVDRAKQEHPYQVPGISVRPIDGGNPEYLTWMAKETEARQEQASDRTSQHKRSLIAEVTGW